MALAKAVLQQGRTTPLVSMQSFDPDERQIPMGLRRPIMLRLLEDGGDFGLPFADHASLNNRLKRLIIAMNTRWESDCDPKAVIGALRCSRLKRARSEGSE